MNVIVYLKDGKNHSYTNVKNARISAEVPNVLQIIQKDEMWFYNMDEVRFYGCYDYDLKED